MVFQDSQKMRERAQASAEALLEKRLGRECEPVPCPDCGHYQRHMLDRAARLRFGWLAKTGLYLLLLSVPFGVVTVVIHAIANQRPAPGQELVATIFASLFGACLAAGVLLPLGRVYCGWRYDPNGLDVDLRLRIGRDLAVKPAEAWRLIDTGSDA